MRTEIMEAIVSGVREGLVGKCIFCFKKKIVNLLTVLLYFITDIHRESKPFFTRFLKSFHAQGRDVAVRKK